KMASISVDQDRFSCPVCLDLLKDPVTTPCGHSFCKVCINGHWDKEDQKGVYSCPQCRDTFTPRPVLRRNNMLAEVKKVKKTEVQAASPAHCYFGPGDVECDFCTRRKRKAVKSCLMCVASLCEIHLKPHYLSPAFKNHTLIEASAKLKEKICTEHEKLMEFYCRTDKTCICFMCMMDNHRGHDTVTATEESAEKQSELKEEQMKFQQRIQEKQKKVQELKQTVNTIKLSAQTAVDDSERIFTELISSMEKKHSEVTELIRAQEKTELSRAERLLEQLEQEIADLQRRLTEMEQLSHTHDHVHFLQALASGRRSSLFDRPNFNTSSITVPQHRSFDGVRNSLSDLKKRLEEFCEEEFNKIPPHAAAVQIISIPEPQSREEFLEYFCYLTLDPNTTHRNLILSEKNRVVIVSERKQQYSDHLERFDSWPQVLSKERVCGRCYWEVERSGKGRELADMMERRKVDILCVQETRWKGSKARSIGAGFKLFYYGVDSKRNGVGVVLKEGFVRNVLEVKRVSDRVMSLKLEIEGVMLNVVSGYAPQVGCELEEKERFWSELDEVMESIPTGERVVIGADFNGHVGERNTSDEEVMGKFGVKERNLEGQMVVDFAKRMDMAVVNTYFQKREEHRVTYKSGGRRTQVVLPDDWEITAEVIRETGRKVLGVSSGRRKEDKETWNKEVHDSVQRKRLAKKKWGMDRTEENRQEYKELQHRVKREVSKAKQKAYDELYTRLDTREGEKDLYRVLTSEESVQRRGKEYFEELMNEENEREKRVEGVNSVEQKVDKIRKDEVRKALKRMKSGKAVGPDDIPVENKGDLQSCSNYRGIKLMSHTMKLWERVVEARLKKVVEICEQQYGFMPRNSTTDAIFALRILMEKYRDGQRELHCVFVDLEKAYDRVPREELWYCMRKSGVAEKYVRVVQDMYERSRTVVRCTEEFKVEVGLHQGSDLSPFLFAIVMVQLSEELRQESPWTMMFADDIVICSESRVQVEENLERWRFALERRGMKVSRSKTEYMCVNEREGSGTVRLQGEEVKKVQEFKYLGSTAQSNGECGKEWIGTPSRVYPVLMPNDA
ncbi:hypothetical protein QTP86_032028, partial [Hemibagrus guttatus]